MKLRGEMNLSEYAPDAIRTFLKTMPGKPFRDSDGEVIGTIVEVNRTAKKGIVEYIIEIDDQEFAEFEQQEQSFSISSSERGDTNESKS